MTHSLPAILLLLALAVNASGVNAGLTPDDPDAAAANDARLEALLNGAEAIEIPAGNFYVAGPVDYPQQYGAPRIKGSGGRCTWLPLDQKPVCATRLISTNGQPVFNLRGHGAIIEDIEFRSFGKRPTALIEVAGLDSPPTGRHVIRDCAFANAECAIAAVGETHADNCTVDHAIVTSCDVFFRSTHRQAVNWRFEGIDINGMGETTPIVVFDTEWVGNLTADHIVLNHPYIVLIRVNRYAKYGSWYDVRGIFFDRPNDELMAMVKAGDRPKPYCHLFEYAGPDWQLTGPMAGAAKWNVKVTGTINCEPDRVEKQRLKIPKGLPTGGFNLSGVSGG